MCFVYRKKLARIARILVNLAIENRFFKKFKLLFQEKKDFKTLTSNIMPTI